MDTAKKRHLLAKKFIGLDAAITPIAVVKLPNGTSFDVEFRKPAFLSRKPFQEGDKSPNSDKQDLNPLRLKPPFLTDYPGFQGTIEGLNIANGKNICYLFLGAQPAEAGIAEKLAQTIQAAVPEAAEAKWLKISVPNEDGTWTDWNRFGFQSEQEYAAFNNIEVNKYPSNFILFTREQLGVQAFIGIRWTNIQEPYVELETEILAALGTFNVKRRGADK